MRKLYFPLVSGGQHLAMALSLTLLTVAAGGAARAQAPNWRVATAGSPTQASGTSQTMATAVDANGNILIAGYFAGSVTFGAMPPLTSAGGTDLFVAKWVPGNGTGTGSWAWAQGAGGTGDDQATGIAVSGTNVYVTGYITNTAADASTVRFGSRTVAGATGTSSADLVLACYTDNTTSATVKWTQVGGGTGADQGKDIAVSGTSVYATGFITNDRANTNAVVFGNAGATVAQYGASTTVSSDLLVVKYTDNATSGTLRWTQVGGGTSGDVGQAIAVGNNSLYVTGNISNNSGNDSNVLFGGTGATAGTVPQSGQGGTSASAILPDLVLAKYTDNGTTATLGWTLAGGGTDRDNGLGVAVSSNNVYVAGYINNNLNDTKKVLFGGSNPAASKTTQLGTSAAGIDLVVAKYTDNGTSATFGWSQVGGGTGSDSGLAIASNGPTVYVSGYITNTTTNSASVVFGGSGTTPGTSTQNGASGTSSADILLASYTDTGASATLNWTQTGGGTGTDQAEGVGFSGSTLYVAGYVVPAASFGTLSVTNPAGSTVNFLGQLATEAPLPVVLTAFSAAPATGGRTVYLAWSTASEAHSVYFEVQRSPDGEVFTPLGTVAAAGSSNTTRSYSFPDDALPSGAPLLYYRLRQVDADGTASYSPVRVVTTALSSPLVLFPNPTRTATTLAGAGPGTTIHVLDALGRVVATATADAAGTATLALPAALPSGVYLVRAGTKAARLAVL